MALFDSIGSSSSAPVASGGLWGGIAPAQTTTNQPAPFFTPSTPSFEMSGSTPAVTQQQINPAPAQPKTYAGSLWGTLVNTVKGLPDAATTVGKAIPGIALGVAQAIPRALISTGMTLAQALPRPEDITSTAGGIFDNIKGIFGGKQAPQNSQDSVLSTYPLTDTAKTVLKSSTTYALGMQPDGVAGTTNTGSDPNVWKTAITLGNQSQDESNFTAAYESFHSLFLHSGTDPAEFNKMWDAAAKNSPEMQAIDKELQDPANNAAYHGNGEDVSKDPYGLATERFAQMGSKFGVDGLQAIPQGLQSYYKQYLKDQTTSQASTSVTPTDNFSKFFLGSEPITSLQTQAKQLSDAFPDLPTPLVALGVAAGDVLNFLPGGGENNVVKALVNVKDVNEATQILRSIGVAEDLVGPAAEKFVTLNKTADVKAGLQSLADFQQTTKISNIKGEISVTQDAIDNSPARGLLKYYGGQDPNFRNLDSIFAKGVGTDAKSATLDSIVTERGYPDVQAAHEAVLSDLQMKQRVSDLKDTLKTLVKPGTTADTIEEALKTLPAQDRASQGALRGAEGGAGRSAIESPSRVSPIQDTTNKVELGVKGTGVAPRVRSAIGASEAIKTQVIDRGQGAYMAGQALSPKDLKLAETYESGKPIGDIVKAAQNPAKMTTFLNKFTDYYDFRLAADRAAGGETPRVENYLPHTWDLSKPADLARFNELATQKGLQPYEGFRSQPRVFSSYAEGEAAGFKRANPTILGDLRADYKGASTAISRAALKQGLNEAAPHMVSASGFGKTETGAAFKNLNIPGLEGLSVHPIIEKMLQGYTPLKNPDFVKLVQKAGASAAIDKSGIGQMIDKTVAMVKAVPASAAEAGIKGTLGGIWHSTSGLGKQLLLNFSGFHSINITLSYLGTSILHPVDAAKGLTLSIASALSERTNAAVVDYFKNTVRKDSTGALTSIYDGAVKSGALQSRELPKEGLAAFNPLTASKAAIFDREIPTMALQLWDTFGAKKGMVADSPEGLALGQEIRTVLGEINTKTMNIDPNQMRIAGHLLLAPGFTYSKAATTIDALTKWTGEDAAAGGLARQAVIGKSVLVGTLATAITLIATGKLPTLGQALLNYTINPSAQTNFTNPKGQKLDITFPKTFIAEWAGLLTSPTSYLENRLNPFLADGIKLYTNQDNIGRPIVDPNVPQSKAMQIAKNLGIGHLPIGMQSVVNQLMGKQSGATTAAQIIGGNTRISASDPSSIKYAGVDKAESQIAALAPDDPNRLQKMQDIFNSLTPAQRKSVAYKELISGVSTKGVYTSEVERKYFQVQDLLKNGDTAGATAITAAMTPKDYSTYKALKTKLAHEATFKQVKTMVANGDVEGATKLTAGMTKAEYKSYQTWKANNP